MVVEVFKFENRMSDGDFFRKSVEKRLFSSIFRTLRMRPCINVTLTDPKCFECELCNSGMVTPQRCGYILHIKNYNTLYNLHHKGDTSM